MNITDVFLATGQLELNLSCMPKPAKSARKCGLHQLPTVEEGKLSSNVETVSLFNMKRVYGWWPCVAEEAGEQMQLAVGLPTPACVYIFLSCPSTHVETQTHTHAHRRTQTHT